MPKKPTHDEQNGDKVNKTWFGSGLLEKARAATAVHKERLKEAGSAARTPKKKKDK